MLFSPGGENVAVLLIPAVWRAHLALSENDSAPGQATILMELLSKHGIGINLCKNAVHSRGEFRCINHKVNLMRLRFQALLQNVGVEKSIAIY